MLGVMCMHMSGGGPGVRRRTGVWRTYCSDTVVGHAACYNFGALKIVESMRMSIVTISFSDSQGLVIYKVLWLPAISRNSGLRP